MILNCKQILSLTRRLTIQTPSGHINNFKVKSKKE